MPQVRGSQAAQGLFFFLGPRAVRRIQGLRQLRYRSGLSQRRQGRLRLRLRNVEVSMMLTAKVAKGATEVIRRLGGSLRRRHPKKGN